MKINLDKKMPGELYGPVFNMLAHDCKIIYYLPRNSGHPDPFYVAEKWSYFKQTWLINPHDGSEKRIK